MTSDSVTPSRQALSEALELSADALRDMETAESPLAAVALKVMRLARILNDFSFHATMRYETAGYPTTPRGLAREIFQNAVAAGRQFEAEDPKTKEIRSVVYTESIAQLEEQVRIADTALGAARDPDVALSSANPYQPVASPTGNFLERFSIRQAAVTAAQRLASRRGLLYDYVLRRHYELKFSGVADDVFTRTRARVDELIGRTVPDAVKRLASTYDNLRSASPEDWSNAVHSCRRIMQDLADAVFPATGDTTERVVNGKARTISLGQDQYINRIIAFIADRSGSARFADVVGSHLSFLGDRLDSLFRAAQKGSHTTIVDKREADRYVVYTYLLLGDVLSLLEPASGNAGFPNARSS